MPSGHPRLDLYGESRCPCRVCVCVETLWDQPGLAQDLVIGVWKGARVIRAQAETPPKAQRVVVVSFVWSKSASKTTHFRCPGQHGSAPARSRSRPGQAPFGVLRLLCPSQGKAGQPPLICWAKPSRSLHSGRLSSPVPPPRLAHVLQTHLC